MQVVEAGHLKHQEEAELVVLGAVVTQPILAQQEPILLAVVVGRGVLRQELQPEEKAALALLSSSTP
jgi:hypothetical protein